ncbi:patatin-like phospholipase family protein [Hydrogenophaga sp. RWCD_12]|uniref:patatin-like phospholipase family protein n=1 Tax=Hydrogenophaga sp. RWCD_12 TaxID=3391190 RepID=UPI003984ED83
MSVRDWSGSFCRLLVSAALLGPLAACMTINRYEGLKTMPLGQVQPRVSPAANGAPRLGIAFGGGGVRGFMHLGVLRALEEAGIRADVVTGTSVGSIAATLYASGMPYAEIEQRVKAVTRFELLDPVFSVEGLVNGRALAAWVRGTTGGRSIAELPVALGIAVTDLGGGSSLLVVDGDPGEAVQASASVPGTVTPVRSGDATFVDGAILSVVPVRYARAMGADVVIGIDIYCGKNPALKGHAIDTILRTFRLQGCTLSETEIHEADFLIRPDFEPVSPTSFDQRDDAILAGYRSMQAVIPSLKERLAARKTP